MKNITKFSLLAATFAVIGTSGAFADNQQLQNQLALERQAAERNQQTSVAVYAHQRGVGQNAMQGDRPELRFELRTNGKGQTFGAYVPVK